MLQRDTQNQRLYLHNVVSIKIEETKIPSQDDSLTNWSDEDNPRLFVTNILQKALKVNINENKSRVNNWLKVNRLQLPLPNTQSNSAINSIPEKPEKVNINERNSKVTMSKAPLCKGSCCEATEGL